MKPRSCRGSGKSGRKLEAIALHRNMAVGRTLAIAQWSP
jgi:hypothetical protein